MIAKLIGSQSVTDATVTPIVDDFDFIQIVRTYISRFDTSAIIQSNDNIFISNGFSGEITFDTMTGGFYYSVIIESVSSSEIKFKNGYELKSYGYINYYKYV